MKIHVTLTESLLMPINSEPKLMKRFPWLQLYVNDITQQSNKHNAMDIVHEKTIHL